jgi:Co/Zn/Cd efflux system component
MVLLLTTFLFATITIVQYSFARIGNVNALISDCKAMAVDTLSYFLNIFAELAPQKWKRKLQLIIPVISLSVLGYFVVTDFLDALDRLKKGDDEDVSIWITFTFGFAGLIFDCISIFAFCKNRKREKQHNGTLPVNMLAAFMHVGADFIRSATTTFESFWLWGAHPENATAVDAICCIIIDVTITLGIIFGLFEVFRDVRVYCQTGE